MKKLQYEVIDYYSTNDLDFHQKLIEVSNKEDWIPHGYLQGGNPYPFLIPVQKFNELKYIHHLLMKAMTGFIYEWCNSIFNHDYNDMLNTIFKLDSRAIEILSKDRHVLQILSNSFEEVKEVITLGSYRY